MRSRSGCRRGLLLLGLLVAGGWSLGCRSQVIPLPNGHRLARMHDETTAILYRDEEVTIPANVDGYRVEGDVVIGHVSTHGLDEDEVRISNPGYFILDTTNRETRQGLQKEEWNTLMSARGIKTAPDLAAPAFH